MQKTLQQKFTDLFQSHATDLSLQEKFWQEIQKHYTSSKRHYHTLLHLENLFGELQPLHEKLEDWDTIQFSLFYHDIIYKSFKSNNEEESALLAVERLRQIGYSEEKIIKCENQILATKSHNFSDTDTNFFTVADLSVLGKDWETYAVYYHQIRKEYSLYPDFLYNNGRKKVLEHFLDMESIFKTEYFQNKYENQARLNIEKELQILDK